MKKGLIRKIILVLIGLNLLGTGVGISVKLGLGTDAVNVAYTAFSALSHLTIGQVTTIMNVILVSVSLILDRSKVGIGTLLCVFLIQYSIDFANAAVVRSDLLIVNLVLFLISQLLMAAGCSLIVIQNIGLSIYDAFVIGISDRFHFPFLKVRYTVDGVFLAVGLLLGGEFGIGTFLSFILLGFFIDRLIPAFKKIQEKIFGYETA